MTSRHWVVVLLAGALLPGPLMAQAGPPYETDDPDPVEYRHWEVYLATQDQGGSGAVAGTAPHVEVNYGALPNLQLHLLVPLAYARPAGGPTTYGLGDVELGAKFRFVQEGTWRPMIGTFVQTEWPVGSTAPGLGTRHVHVLFPLWLQKSFGPWTTDLGGGFLADFDEGYRNYWCFGWQVGRRISPLATIGAELFYTPAHRDSTPNSLRTDLGVVLDLSEHDHVLLSVGRSISGDPIWQGYLAYQLTFGPRSQPSRLNKELAAFDDR